jgi:hypothetical protein
MSLKTRRASVAAQHGASASRGQVASVEKIALTLRDDRAKQLDYYQALVPGAACCVPTKAASWAGEKELCTR